MPLTDGQIACLLGAAPALVLAFVFLARLAFVGEVRS